MATPLQAFLMLYHADGIWDVEVYHDLEILLNAWERHNDGEKTAVIHVGFARLPSIIFGDCAQKFPGRVLLTAAAKFALPKGYETSFSPINNIDGSPIYLATRGWGYESDELDRLAALQPSQYFKEKWLLEFLDCHASYVVPLLEAGITDDSSYMEHEHVLDYGLRKLLGGFRLTYLIGNETENPCLFAKSAPPWLTEQAVQGLNTTVRIANVFQKSGVIYISLTCNS